MDSFTISITTKAKPRKYKEVKHRRHNERNTAHITCVLYEHVFWVLLRCSAHWAPSLRQHNRPAAAASASSRATSKVGRWSMKVLRHVARGRPGLHLPWTWRPWAVSAGVGVKCDLQSMWARVCSKHFVQYNWRRSTKIMKFSSFEDRRLKMATVSKQIYQITALSLTHSRIWWIRIECLTILMFKDNFSCLFFHCRFGGVV